MYVILAIAGILILGGFLYLFRRQVMAYALSRGISLVQRLVFQVVWLINSPEKGLPRWVLLKDPASARYTMGVMTQPGPTYSTVFVPSGPRLFPGQTVFVENIHWRYLEVDFEEGLEMLISLGLLPGTEDISHKIWKRMEEF